MFSSKKIREINLPDRKLTMFSYLLLFFSLFFSKLLLYETIIVNLPYEIQYPHFYPNIQNGFTFVSFGEGLKSLLDVQLLWKNSLPPILIKDISVCWELIPEKIQLAVNMKALSFAPRFKTLRSKIISIIRMKKQQVKLVYYDNLFHNLVNNFV